MFLFNMPVIDYVSSVFPRKHVYALTIQEVMIGILFKKVYTVLVPTIPEKYTVSAIKLVLVLLQNILKKYRVILVILIIFQVFQPILVFWLVH